jgi:fumarate reductase flavoprotein subunit
VANSTVYGGVAGDVMGADIAGMSALRDPDEAVLSAEIDRARRPLSKTPGFVNRLRHGLQEAMWDDVGVMRTEVGMRRGVARVADIKADLMEAGVAGDTLAFNLTWHDWLNMASLCDVSAVIAKAGIARENSRGAHFREDFPQEGDLDGSYYTVARQTGDDLTVTREPVQFTIVRPGETILPESEPETLVAAEC